MGKVQKFAADMQNIICQVPLCFGDEEQRLRERDRGEEEEAQRERERERERAGS
jgi:hypothetical protein